MSIKTRCAAQPSFLQAKGSSLTTDAGQSPPGNTDQHNADGHDAGQHTDHTGASAPKGSLVEVLLPLPLPAPYSYLLPEEMTVETGQFVKVPLAGRMLRGCVWSTSEGGAGHAVSPLSGSPLNGPPLRDKARLKLIDEVYDTPPLAPAVMDFVSWVSAYTLSPPGAVLRLVMRAGAELEAPPQKTLWHRPAVIPQNLCRSGQRRQLIAGLPRAPASIAAIARAAGVSPSVVRGFAKAGGLVQVKQDADAPFAPPDPARNSPQLSASQSAAARPLCHAARQSAYRCEVLDGVTGAGKTEVYLEAVAAVLDQDPDAQILILLPEIALTLPFLERVSQRFGAAPAPWHSDMKPAARRRVWRRVLDGGARLVVGARSALFLPFRNLRLIIVDEEHEAAYKQGEGVMYHARDMAVARASQGRFCVILASATPSLETVINIEAGRYGHARLEARYGAARLPDIEILDLRQTPPLSGQWLAPRVIDGITETILAGRQALLFLNRRGYAPLVICRKCGERLMAPDSDTWLVEHRSERRLVCHHTGFSMPTPDTCPHCGSSGSLAACGPGVERIAEEARHHWPAARVEIFSSDSVSTPGAAQALLARMQAGEIDVLVATQVVAKGHHFPNLTCVGVVDADLGLSGGDLRAAERTYQLLSQVAGRAGRAAAAGKVFLQSWQPHNPVIQSLATGDRDGFMRAEAAGRQALGFPPFGRLASVLLTAENEQKLNETARALARVVPHAEGIEVWGPAPAAFYRLRGACRVRFLVKADRTLSIQRYLTEWLSAVRIPAAVRHIVDIDPYHFG